MLKHLALFLCLAACGGKTIEPLDDAGANDGAINKDVVVFDVGPPTDAFPPPGDSGLQCNNLDPGTKSTTIEMIPADPPPFASSSTFITPGLYELVSITIYTGPKGQSGSGGTIAGELRVNVANSADYIFQVASVQDNQAPTHSNSSANNAGTGVIVISQTCPQPQPPIKVSYAADASSFTIRVDTGNQTADEQFAFIGQ